MKPEAKKTKRFQPERPRPSERKPRETESLLYGRNEVKEALRSDSVRKLYFDASREADLQELLSIAEEKHVPKQAVSKEELTALSCTDFHQGAAAVMAPFRYSEVDDMLWDAKEKGEKPFLLLLDGIQDPHNLGAIIRTAHQAGVHGVILPKDRAAEVTPTVCKTSAGAVHHVKIARVVNLARTIDDLKEKGLWFILADMDGSSLYDLDYSGPVGLIIGSEGSGARKLVREKADHVASIPMKGEIDSLNASVAAGILMYEAVRQRLAARR